MHLLKFETWKRRNPDTIWFMVGQIFLLSQSVLSRLDIVSSEAELVYGIVAVLISFIGFIMFSVAPIRALIDKNALSQSSIEGIAKLNIVAFVVWTIFLVALIFFLIR